MNRKGLCDVIGSPVCAGIAFTG